MKRHALRTLVCPFTRSNLSLISFEETTVELTDDDIQRCHRLGIDPAEANAAVKEGVLYSHTSRKWFPIVNYVPIMLDFPTEIHRAFKEHHSAQADILTQYEMANGKPRAGELFVQRTFTQEWALLDLDNLSFGYDSAQRDEFVKLELDWPPRVLEQAPLNVLEVGCGSGFESAALERVTAGQIMGFDLNLALVGKGHLLAPNPFINISIASLFNLPLRPGGFEIVYSNGVLHHTYSTKKAFDAISQYRAPHGIICIWVYAHEDYVTTIRGQLNYLIEAIFRPRIARLPDLWLSLVVKIMARRHYHIYRKHGGLSRARWTFKDSEHSVRDRWTPLYAHRHTFKEVILWMENLGLEYRLLDSQAYENKIGIPLIGIGIRGAPASYFDKAFKPL